MLGLRDFRQDFSGKKVLITGASSGIGAELARQLSRAGATLILIARRKNRLEAIHKELSGKQQQRKSLQKTYIHECDITSSEAVEKLFRGLIDEVGALDIVIANAGFSVSGKISKLSVEDYRRQFETNFFGLINTIKNALPFLESTSGQLILMGSVASYLGLPASSCYVSSKFAVRGLGLSLYHELRAKGIATTLISPGFVQSEIRQVDNQGKHHPSEKDPIPSYLLMPTDKAVEKMLKGIAKKKREIIITGHGKLIVFLQKHFEGLVHFLIRVLGTKGRKAPQ